MNTDAVFRIGAPLTGEPQPVLQWVEVASFLQIPSFHIIGLPAPEVAEARERVRAAIEAANLEFPRRRVIINLSPAHVRKRGTGMDLSIALAILHDTYGLPPLSTAGKIVAWGELGLDGVIKAAGQVTRAVYAAWEANAELLIVARSELKSAQERMDWIRASGELIGQAPLLLGASNLTEAWEQLRGFGKKSAANASIVSEPVCPEPAPEFYPPGTELLMLPGSLERVLVTAAVGAHHLLLLGSRGTGKSHALEWLMALQPPVAPGIRLRHALLAELGTNTSRNGVESDGGAKGSVPIRRIGAQARPAALMGGASTQAVRPGEFTLAHGGLLVADEFLEWPRDSREALREPLERGRVTLTRANRSVELPARFALAANGNFCPCGGWPREVPIPLDARGRRTVRCKCTESVRKSYLSRLSGPILDRMDLVVMVSGTPAPQSRSKAPLVNSAAARFLELRERARVARERVVASWGMPPGQLTSSDLESLITAHPEWRQPLDPASFASLRSRHKALRVALTLAAWDGTEKPSLGHFAEAACYRAERFGLTQ